MFKNRLVLIFLGFIAFFALQALFIYIFGLVLRSDFRNPKIIGPIVSSISYFAVVYFLIKKLHIIIKFNYKLTPALVLVLLLLVFTVTFLDPLFVLSDFVTNASNNAIATTVFNFNKDIWNVEFLVYSVFVVFTVPVLEEFFFRKIMLTALYKKYGFAISIILSSLFFGLIHVDINQIQLAFFAGIILGYIYLKTNNLFVCILLHMLFNLLVRFSISEPIELSSNYYMLFVYAMLLVFVYFLTNKLVKIINTSN